MQDELLMRDWTALHEDFVAGLEGAPGAPGTGRIAMGSNADPIEPAYPLPVGDQSSRLSPAAQASLRGFAASIVTALLWVTLMTLAMPASGLGSAPAVAAARAASSHVYPALA
jgi:hypothetical protein